jgi:dolichol-phosphate mannosyltransferase
VNVSVVLPTYNEGATILPLIADVHAALRDAEIVVVDDDSPDGTWRIVGDAFQGDDRVRVIRRIGRRGLPTALAEGLAAGKGEALVWLDADGSMPPFVIPDLIAGLGDADIAVASRYVAGGEDARDSRFRRVSSWIINAFAAMLLSPKVRDYTSGFIAVRRTALERLPLRTNYVYGEYCIDLLYRACRAGLTVREVPYRNVERVAGETKTAPSFRRFAVLGFAYFKAIVKLRVTEA